MKINTIKNKITSDISGQNKFNDKTIYYGIVINNNDPIAGSNRLKIRIKELDYSIPDDEIEWALPLFPPFFYHTPKKGEVVRIIIVNKNYPQRNRLWISNVVSSIQDVNFSTSLFALSNSSYGLFDIKRKVDQRLLLGENDIALIGRSNSRVVLGKNSVRVVGGIGTLKNDMELNIKNPSSQYLKLFDNDLSVNISQADVIGLLSHKINDPKFKYSVSEIEDIEDLLERGFSMVRGEVLIDILKIIIKGLVNHIHSHPTLPPEKTEDIKNVDKISFTKAINKFLKIN